MEESQDYNIDQTANFRRKISDYVTETEKFTSGAGHRPARLYQRKS